MRIRFSLILLSVFVLFLACSQPPGLTVFGAMSLTDALTEIGEQFRGEHGVRIYFNFAASSTLQRQLEKGASADVFISASPHQITALERLEMLVLKSRHNILSNRLVLVSQDSSPSSLLFEGNNPAKAPFDALIDKSVSRIAIGHPDIVPAGTYARQALTDLKLWDTLQPKLIFGADVRATLAYVTAGNADVAIVYETDATLAEHVKVLAQFPPTSHDAIVYPAVILKQSQRKSDAQQFIDYLKTVCAVKIFDKHGFTCLLSQ